MAYNVGGTFRVYSLLPLRIMFTKRIILLIIGIFVAIAICLSTSLFGMRMDQLPSYKFSTAPLKADSDFVLVIDRYVDGNAVITKF